MISSISGPASVGRVVMPSASPLQPAEPSAPPGPVENIIRSMKDGKAHRGACAATMADGMLNAYLLVVQLAASRGDAKGAEMIARQAARTFGQGADGLKVAREADPDAVSPSGLEGLSGKARSIMAMAAYAARFARDGESERQVSASARKVEKIAGAYE